MFNASPSAASAQHPREFTVYDPIANARYYRWRFFTVFARAIQIVWLFGHFAIQLQFDRWSGQVEKNTQQRAKQFSAILTNLGPASIKIGQALSTRPDLVPQDYLDELVILQDQLPSFSSKVAFQIIEDELGRSLGSIYAEISPEPIAAASLGQVYKATLHNGDRVAVKVQRPELRKRLNLDLYLLRLASGWLERVLPLKLGHSLTLVVDEFGAKLYEEIDYLNEARNAEKFAANFFDDPEIKVPQIYWAYTNRRVITMEWIDGYKLTDTASIQAAGLDVNNLIRLGVTSGLRQLLEHGFFHADPHPGNLFAMPDGRMAYIDFGMMDQLDEPVKETIASAVVQLINNDYQGLADDFVSLGFLTPDVDLVPIVPALQKVLGQGLGQSVANFNFKTITDEFSDLMYEYPFRIPAKFALIIRSIVTQEGVALSLNPNFKIVEVSYPYVSRRLLTEESPAMRRRLVEVLFKGGKFQWERLENMIAIAQSEGNFDIVPTAKMGLQYLLSDEGRYLRHQLLNALTENDTLHTDELQRIWQLVKDDLPPQRMFGVAFDTLRQMSALQMTAILPG
ncbi:MAG: AarF/ABC1/UbiB kinase family protein [Cyanobacteria bacterium P01_H01_bin.15]